MNIHVTREVDGEVIRYSRSFEHPAQVDSFKFAETMMPGTIVEITEDVDE